MPAGWRAWPARMRRAEMAIEFAVAAAREALAPGPWPQRGPIAFATAQFAGLPAEVALRLLGRAIAHAGDEGPVELAKLESLYDALRQADSRLRRTLAGALITPRWRPADGRTRAGAPQTGFSRAPQRALYEIALLLLACGVGSLGRGRAGPYIAGYWRREAATICRHA